MLKHGLYGTRIYKIWRGMKDRCLNPNAHGYELYGGRGIKICDEWLNDISAFWKWSQLNGYADNLSIDRIDVDGDYSPENCRWATPKEQANNQRSNRKITYKGETKNLNQWIEHLGLNHTMVHDRLRSGWSVDDAFEIPKDATRGLYNGEKHHSYKNGLTHSRTYPTWIRIKSLGVEVCEQWRTDFMNFYNDMGAKPDGHKLIRLNPYINYCKENCKWVPSADIPKYTSVKMRLSKLALIAEYECLLGLDISSMLHNSTQSHSISEMFKKIGLSIKKLRKERNLTQSQLSEISGIGKYAISKVELGYADLASNTYMLILKALTKNFVVE